MLFNGEGVDKDPIAAYSWLSIASHNQEPQAMANQQQVSTFLSTQQIRAAEKLTAEFYGTLILARTTQAELTGYRVQVGAFKSMTGIEGTLTKLKQILPDVMAKYSSIVIKPKSDRNKAGSYKLQLGTFDNATDASALCKRISRKKQPCFIVKILPAS